MVVSEGRGEEEGERVGKRREGKERREKKLG